MSRMIRRYDPGQDRDAVLRILRECGWIQGDELGWVEPALGCPAYVGVLHDEAECVVIQSAGTLRHGGRLLPADFVLAVATSHVGRRQGLARRVTAHGIAEQAAGGAAVSLLGMFDQGFYNRIGFGTSAYEVLYAFDPADLQLPDRVRARPPIRLTTEDAGEIHAARLGRMQRHGNVRIEDTAVTRSALANGKASFGLGYRDAHGRLTHCLWCYQPSETEHGPWQLSIIVYENYEQLLELLDLLRSLSDQVYTVRMAEPAGFQLQDVLHLPARRQRTRNTGDHAFAQRAVAYTQLRMCDVSKCIRGTAVHMDPVHFNLELTDPIAPLVESHPSWRGVGGTYRVTLGPESEAEPGPPLADRPTMRASVNAFSRLWLGSRRALGLAATDDLDGDPQLLESLDRAYVWPEPLPDWDF
jgi:hypothetical protein